VLLLEIVIHPRATLYELIGGAKLAPLEVARLAKIAPTVRKFEMFIENKILFLSPTFQRKLFV
jgi:hypothetical protein